VALADAAAAAEFVLQHPEIDAAVNVTAPEPATSATFAHKFGHVLHRPAIAPLPAVAARLMLGEMADELLLPSQRVLPARLQAAGFAFSQPALEPALQAAVGR
jgi:NAD dependent epimerase/dehydratase family enzyme